MSRVRTAVGLLVIAGAAAGAAAHAEALRGLWTADRSRWKVDKGGTATIVQLSMRRSAGRHDWNSSFPVPLTELEGLSDAQLDGADA